jgi:hypothetical protein
MHYAFTVQDKKVRPERDSLSGPGIRVMVWIKIEAGDFVFGIEHSAFGV